MDWVNDENRGRAWLCRFGLHFTAIALGLLCLSDFMVLVSIVPEARAIVRKLLALPFWDQGVHAAIPITGFLGAFFLWGRWEDSGWRKAAGLLLALDGFDALSWLVLDTELFGRIEFAHQWLHSIATEGFGWIELALTAWLAHEIASRLGVASATITRLAQAARGQSGIGLGLWLLFALVATDWTWPLQQGPLDLIGYLVFLCTRLVQATVTFQVTVLCLTVAWECRRLLREESFGHEGHELLRSRSETEGDDIFWK